MAPKYGDTVHVYHRVCDSDGTEIESSFGKRPLLFTIGDREIHSAFSKATEGLEKGERASVVVPAAEAYGEYDPKKTRSFRKKQFLKPLKPDEVVTFSGEFGEPRRYRVLREEEDGYVLDMNHLLAGKDLTFEIELLDVVEAP